MSERDVNDLDRFWDAIAAGTPDDPEHLDLAQADTIRRFHAAEDVPGADPAFLAQLMEDLMLAQDATVWKPVVAPVPIHSNGRATPGPWRHLVPGAAVAGPGRRWSVAHLATAALMLMTVGFAYLTFRPDRSGSPATLPAAFSSVATPGTAMDEGKDVPMFRANPEHTGEMPGPGPDPDLPIAERWSFTAEGVIYGSPAVVDGVVYVGSFDHNVYALDADTGQQRWVFSTGAEVFSSPAVVDGVVYVGSDDHNVYALDADTGQQRWAFETGDVVEGSSPAVVDGVVYVGSNDGNLYALDAATGKERWAFATGDWVAAPAVANGVVYVGNGHIASNSGTVFAIDTSTGKQRWAFATGGWVSSSPAVANGVVYVGSGDRNVYALDAANGEQRWAFTTSDTVHSSPAVADGVVYVGNGTIHASSGNLYALDADTGQQRWVFATGGNIFASPVVADGVVYFASWDHDLYALDAASGEEHWSFTTGDIVTSSAAVVDGIVYFGGEDSKVYALESAAVELSAASTPAPEYGTEETLFEITIPADQIPVGSNAPFALAHLSVPVGRKGTWKPTCCPGPLVDYLVAGTMTFQAQGAAEVVRADGTVETIPFNTPTTLAAGDAFVTRNEVETVSVNTGESPAEVLEWFLVDNSSELFNGRSTADQWLLHRIDPIAGPTMAGGAATLRLQRVELAAGATIPIPPGVIQAGVTLYRNDLGTPTISKVTGVRGDGPLRNTGDQTEQVYVMSLIPEPASASSATPVP